jgi:1,4-alpha-glucan branching enzyme
VYEVLTTRRTLFVVLSLFALAASVSCGRLLEEAVDSPVIGEDNVRFRLKSPAARTVQVAGDWNNWASGDAETGEVLVGLMKQDPQNGIWELAVELEPGRYRYRFLVDEVHWVLDPNNPRVVEDMKGGKVNLLIIP